MEATADSVHDVETLLLQSMFIGMPELDYL